MSLNARLDRRGTRAVIVRPPPSNRTGEPPRFELPKDTEMTTLFRGLASISRSVASASTAKFQEFTKQLSAACLKAQDSEIALPEDIELEAFSPLLYAIGTGVMASRDVVKAENENLDYLIPTWEKLVKEQVFSDIPAVDGDTDAQSYARRYTAAEDAIASAIRWGFNGCDAENLRREKFMFSVLTDYKLFANVVYLASMPIEGNEDILELTTIKENWRLSQILRFLGESARTEYLKKKGD